MPVARCAHGALRFADGGGEIDLIGGRHELARLANHPTRPVRPLAANDLHVVPREERKRVASGNIASATVAHERKLGRCCSLIRYSLFAYMSANFGVRFSRKWATPSLKSGHLKLGGISASATPSASPKVWKYDFQICAFITAIDRGETVSASKCA